MELYLHVVLAIGKQSIFLNMMPFKDLCSAGFRLTLNHVRAFLKSQIQPTFII